jgi:hypothetical protein
MADQDEFELIDSRSRYVLGAGTDYYGIWDTEQLGRPLSRFSLTDEGLGQAQEEFDRLLRLNRNPRAMLSRVLRTTLFAGLALWAVAGGIYSWLYVRTEFGSPASIRAIRVFYVAQIVAFRVWVGALALLAAMWLQYGRAAFRKQPPTA